MPTSSIGSPTRTERQWLARLLGSAILPTAIATALLTIVFISFRPFQPNGAIVAGQTGGDIVNQAGFGATGMLALFALVTYVNPRVISAMLSPWWLLMTIFVAFAVSNSLDVQAAQRASLFTLLGVITIVAVLSLPRDAEAYSTVFAISGISVVALSYIGLVLLPSAAIHTDAGPEGVHAGLWRGVFSHKNIAGPVMAGFCFAGLYLFRRGWRYRGGLLLAAALLFIAHTGSKTTVGLVPLAMAIVMIPGLIGMRRLTVLLIAVALVGTALGTLGIVFIAPVKVLVLGLIPDLTYTGRTSLWEFAGEMIALRPWTGYGYESFWGLHSITDAYHPFDREWDVRPMVHGHNGYIDIAVTMGLPALGVAIFTFLIAPLRDYMRVPRLRENVLLADFFLMVLLFASLNAFLESFFFRRADPVWLFFVMGCFGLRLVARIPIPSSIAKR